MRAATVQQPPRYIAYPANTLTVQVVRYELIAPDVVTLSLATPGTMQSPGAYQPGQFITLMIPQEHGLVYRSYSLCGSGDPRAPWEITIKRMRNGISSTYLFEQVRNGVLLKVTPPRGTFVLPAQVRADQSYVFIAVGSGITSIRGMLQAIATLPASRRPRVQLHYASSAYENIIYRDELARIDPQHQWLRQWHYLSSQGQRLTPASVFANARPVPRDSHWYMCGPDDLSLAFASSLSQLHVPPTQIHSEIFTDQSRKPAKPGAGASRVTIRETGATIDVRDGESLLESLERNGYQPDFSCRSGNCGTCQLHVLRGRVSNPGNAILTPSERKAGMILSCIAQPQGEVILESGGKPPRGTKILVRSASSQRAETKNHLRLGAVLSTGVVLAGLWTMTSHKPVSEHAVFVSPSVNQYTGSGGGDDGGGFNNSGGSNTSSSPVFSPPVRSGSS